jgi:hypothetical protein
MTLVMSAFGGKADIIQGKADIKKCPLMTQSGHGGTVGSHAVLRLHLLMSIDQKVVEILNANESEPRIFHVCERVKGDR